MNPQNKNPRSPAANPLHVETVKTVQGPAATAISVDVDREKLPHAGAAAAPTSAVARVPTLERGQKTVREEELLRTGTRLDGARHTVDTFAKTIPGGVEAGSSDFDVGVRVAGETVWAKDGLASAAQGRDADRPEPRPAFDDAAVSSPAAGLSWWPVVGAAALLLGAGYLGYRAVRSSRRQRRYGALARFL